MVKVEDYFNSNTMKALHTIAFILVIIGGLNWLLVGFNWNLVDAIFNVGSYASRAIYILVGLSAIYLVITHKKSCGDCSSSKTPSTPAGTM
ncbi:MAG: hypothetical protein RIT04_633 [Candidatus Parcubacteria bacterium]